MNIDRIEQQDIHSGYSILRVYFHEDDNHFQNMVEVSMTCEHAAHNMNKLTKMLTQHMDMKRKLYSGVFEQANLEHHNV